MKELVLLRHGEALSVRGSGALEDGGRTLSALGREQIKASAARLKAIGFAPDIIIHSPLLRAAETAEIAAGLFPAARTLKEPLLASCAPLNDILNALSSAAGGSASVLAAGHQPIMGELSALLLGAAPPPFRTGSFAYIKFRPDRGAELADFFSPEPI